MHILQVSTSDVRGGAERIAQELTLSLPTRGHSSETIVGAKTGVDPNISTLVGDELENGWTHFWQTAGHPVTQRHLPGASILIALARMGEPKRYWNYLRGIEDFDHPATYQLLNRASHTPDLVHAHNLHGDYFDLRFLPLLSHQTPVVVTLHDAWLLSGHCAHSFACERWRTGCGRCPDLTVYPRIRRDATAFNWRRKQDIYSRSRLYVTVPCRWLEEKLNGSMLQQAVVKKRLIHHGIDLSVFHPGDKSIARDMLDIPQNARMVLFVAYQARNNRFKDFYTMQETVRKLGVQPDRQELLFVCLGEKGMDERIGSASIRYVDYVNEPATVAQFYQAADVYLHAAHAEVWGLSITEAMACGAPVVATAVGGIPEQIDEGRTGFLVPPRDSEAMANRITQLIEDAELHQRMSVGAAASARRRFGLERMVDDYVEWYQEVIQDWREWKAA